MIDIGLCILVRISVSKPLICHWQEWRFPDEIVVVYRSAGIYKLSSTSQDMYSVSMKASTPECRIVGLSVFCESLVINQLLAVVLWANHILAKAESCLLESDNFANLRECIGTSIVSVAMWYFGPSQTLSHLFRTGRTSDVLITKSLTTYRNRRARQYFLHRRLLRLGTHDNLDRGHMYNQLCSFRDGLGAKKKKKVCYGGSERRFVVRRIEPS